MKKWFTVLYSESVFRNLRFFCVLLSVTFCSVNAIAQQTSYSCDFEDEYENSQWNLNVGPKGQNAINKWYVDNAINNGGKRSLYISSDGGTTATYSATPTSISAYRTLTLPAGSYEISFDWQAFGYSKSDKNDTIMDALYFLWMPDSVKSNSQTSNSTLPAYVENYAVPFNGNIRLAGKTWNTVSSVIQSDGVTPYKLVFVWNNNATYSFPPGAAIDNISIIPAGSCDKPDKIKIELLDNEQVKISWSGNADSYDIRCKAATDTKWQEFKNYQGNEINVSGMGEGVCDVFIRSNCDQFSSVYVSHSQFIYYPGTRCVDYMSLTPRNCYYGAVSSPTSNRGVIDNGYLSMDSRHTIHYNKAEVDPRTNGRLKTVPDDEIASVRLGNWQSGGQAEAIQYDYLVDTAENAILLLKYSVVLQNPNHEEEEQPRFTLQVLENGKPIDADGCAEADFSAGFVSGNEGWHEEGGSVESIQWKEWTTVGINLKEHHNKDLTIKLVTYDCDLGGHYGYSYFALGCSDGKIEGLSCGESATNRFKAPDGFLYRWYHSDNPDKTLSEDQIFETDPMDTMTYHCDVIQPTKAECYYTVSANATPRYPVAAGSVKNEIRDCKNYVTLQDGSYVHHINPETGRIEKSQDDCDSVIWHFLYDGTTYNATDDFEKEFPEEGGKYQVMLRAHLAECYTDTVFEIELPYLGASRDTTTVIECDASYYHWDLNGKNYFSSGFYSDTLQTGNEHGCESITVLNLTLVNIEPTQISDTVCSNDLPYIFHGYEFYETCIFTDTLKSCHGCDSVVSLSLTVNESLEFDGIQSRIAANGCADEENIRIPYTLTSGMITSYDITFDDNTIDQYLGVTNATPETSELIIPVVGNILPGRYTGSVLFRNAYCDDITLPLDLDIYYPESIIVQRWNDVLGILNTEYNGGYDFIQFQWYKNGTVLNGEISSVLYAPEELDFNAAYSAMLTRANDGISVMTCDFRPQKFSDIEIKPTIVFSGNSVNITSQTKGVARVWNTMGQLIGTYRVTDGHTAISAPDMAGTYIMEIILNNGTRKTEKILVRSNI